MKWSSVSHAANEHHIESRSFLSKTTVLWSEVIEINGRKISKITYDENFLVIRDSSGLLISVGELDKEFDQVLSIVSKRFNIPEDWRTQLESSPAGISLTLWKCQSRGDDT